MSPQLMTLEVENGMVRTTFHDERGVVSRPGKWQRIERFYRGTMPVWELSFALMFDDVADRGPVTFDTRSAAYAQYLIRYMDRARRTYSSHA